VSVVDSESRDTAVVDAPPEDVPSEDTMVGDPDSGGSGLTCADIDAARNIGFGVVDGDNAGADNTYLECGEGPEQLVSWAAPATGFYSVRVTSPTMVPQLGVLADDCVGMEVACDMDPVVGGDTGAGNTSQVLRMFDAGAPVVFIVSDAYMDTGGNYTLDIEEASCAGAVDAGVTLGLRKGSTTPGSRWFDGTCGTGDTREATIRFEAPMDGEYDIDTSGSGFDTVLYVRDGDCSGPEIACNKIDPEAWVAA